MSIGDPQIIYEDDYLLALNKPVGWVVNDAQTAHGNPTLQDWIDKNFDFEIAHNTGLRNGIVHRLDKPTSGVILIAKTEDIFNALQSQFTDRQIEKIYIALVHGKVEPETGIINQKIGRLPWKRTNFGVIDTGRDAVTGYKVIRVIPTEAEESLSYLELYPKTGRTHQLRVHLKHIGNPIVGDHLYAARKIGKADLKKFGRLMLHAQSIKFIHPVTKKEIFIEAPLPEDFK